MNKKEEHPFKILNTKISIRIHRFKFGTLWFSRITWREEISSLQLVAKYSFRIHNERSCIWFTWTNRFEFGMLWPYRDSLEEKTNFLTTTSSTLTLTHSGRQLQLKIIMWTTLSQPRPLRFAPYQGEHLEDIRVGPTLNKA